MVIEKVINNNIVVSRDEQQAELILMGRGLGFKAKRGAEIDMSKVEKIFRADSSEKIHQLSVLLNDISLEELEVATQILDKAKQKLGEQLSENELIALSDHIHNAIMRQSKGIALKNNLLWDIKRFYPREYQLGQFGVELIAEKTGVVLEEDEAGFIALHLVEANLEQKVDDIDGMTRFIQEVIQILKYACRQPIDENSAYYYRFITHLKYLAQRVFNAELKDSQDEVMAKLVQKQYPIAYDHAKKVITFIEQQYDCQLSSDEYMYLTLHIEKLIQNTKNG